MKIGYDPRGDILFVKLGDLAQSVGAREVSKGTYIDAAEDGTILGIEILHASDRYPKEAMAQFIAYPEEPISLGEAARIAEVSQQALRKACERGRLVGKKIGRNWTTTVGALQNYLNDRKHSGPGSKTA